MEPLTLLLAVWGAVVSTVALGWNVYLGLTNKGKLRVSCFRGGIINSDGTADPNEYLFWAITNVGRQSILLTHYGGKRRGKKGNFVLDSRLPHWLKPGEYFDGRTTDFDLLGQADLKGLGAWDSLNNYYTAPRRDVHRLKKEYAQGPDA